MPWTSAWYWFGCIASRLTKKRFLSRLSKARNPSGFILWTELIFSKMAVLYTYKDFFLVVPLRKPYIQLILRWVLPFEVPETLGELSAHPPSSTKALMLYQNCDEILRLSLSVVIYESVHPPITILVCTFCVKCIGVLILQHSLLIFVV